VTCSPNNDARVSEVGGKVPLSGERMGAAGSRTRRAPNRHGVACNTSLTMTVALPDAKFAMSAFAAYPSVPMP